MSTRLSEETIRLRMMQWRNFKRLHINWKISNTRLTAKNKGLKQAVDQLEREGRQKQREIERQNAKIAELERGNRQKQQKIDKQNQAIDKHNDKVDKLEKDNQRKQKKIDKQSIEIADLNRLLFGSSRKSQRQDKLSDQLKRLNPNQGFKDWPNLTDDLNLMTKRLVKPS